MNAQDLDCFGLPNCCTALHRVYGIFSFHMLEKSQPDVLGFHLLEKSS
jgi:hypothetical protein